MVVLLKALFFTSVLRLHVCEAVWSRLTALRLLRSIHCLWGVF